MSVRRQVDLPGEYDVRIGDSFVASVDGEHVMIKIVEIKHGRPTVKNCLPTAFAQPVKGKRNC
jgi:hypothetical protein